MSEQIKDLRSFIQDIETNHPEALVRITRPISINYELTALQVKMAKMNRHPILIFEKPVLLDGTISPYPIVANLTASRELLAEAIGINPRRVPIEYNAAAARRLAPVVISKEQAPVKEVIRRGAEADALTFPWPVHQDLDPGQYISAGYTTTYDPDTGIDNSSIQRVWVKQSQRMGYYPQPTSHAYMNMMKWWQKGEPMPIAIWVGHHPAALAGTMIRCNYPESHWHAAGGVMGQPMRLVPSETFGDKLMVPADAEMIIEGVVPVDVWETEGPFGEFTGYAGPQRPNPVIEVKCVTHRKSPILHTYACGIADMLVLGMFPLESRIYDTVKRVIPELQNVHCPLSGTRLHAYLQVKKTRAGVGKDVILAAVNADPRPKHFFVVDEDIDIFKDSEVMWAIATRTQWNRDVMVFSDVTSYALDPSLSAPGTFGAKGGIDATLPPPLDLGLPRQYQAVNRAPKAVQEGLRLEDYINPDDLAKFPTSF